MKQRHILSTPFILSFCVSFLVACGQTKTSDFDADIKYDQSSDHEYDEFHNHDEHMHQAAEEGALSAHVHGEGQFVIVRTQTGFLANFIAPLASVGLKPSLEDISKLPKDVTQNWLETDSAAKCMEQKESRLVSIIRTGDHGELDLDVTFTCKNMDKLSNITLAIFDQTSALEKVEGLLIVNGDQKVQTLTQESPAIILN